MQQVSTYTIITGTRLVHKSQGFQRTVDKSALADRLIEKGLWLAVTHTHPNCTESATMLTTLEIEVH